MAKITAEDLGMLHARGMLRFEQEDGDGAPICRIEDSWFRFAGLAGDEDGRRYLAGRTSEELLAAAAEAIDEWDSQPEFAEYALEHAYYATLVQDCLKDQIRDLEHRADALRNTISFLHENEEYGDDWVDETDALDVLLNEVLEQEGKLERSAARFDEEIRAALDPRDAASRS